MTAPAVVLAVLGPLIAGVVLAVINRMITRADHRADERAAAAARDAWTTHVVLRELVRAMRAQAVPMRLPPGW